MDQVVLDGKTYIPSKRAASEFGYTQDYVGQLCRGGAIDARRISGQWYIYTDSLKAYKEKAETFKPEPPKYQPDPNAEATLNVEGKEYVSAALAAKLTEYNQDYVGQLARAGKIPSRQIGNRWYVDKDAVLTHKKEKDALLRAVQAESVGLQRPQVQASLMRSVYGYQNKPEEKLMTYHKDDKPLFPELLERIEEISLKAQSAGELPEPTVTTPSRIAIRVVSTSMTLPQSSNPTSPRRVPEAKKIAVQAVSVPGKSIFQALFRAVAFSLVLIAAVGLGVYKRDIIYAGIFGTNSSQTAAAETPTRALLDRLLTKELLYIRAN